MKHKPSHNKHTDIINSIVASHRKTARCLLDAARHYLRAAEFERTGEPQKAIASVHEGQKEISEANEEQGECLWMPG